MLRAVVFNVVLSNKEKNQILATCYCHKNKNTDIKEYPEGTGKITEIQGIECKAKHVFEQ